MTKQNVYARPEPRDALGIAGKNINGYCVKEHLVEAGFACIYLAYDQESERDVVLKLLRPDKSHQPYFVEKALHEGEVLRSLDHPGIIKCFKSGYFEVGSQQLPGTVLEYFPGRNLGDLIEDGLGQKISLVQKSELILRGAYALAYAHQKDIMHLDVTPENILVNQNEVKLIDFAFSKNISCPQPNHISGNGKSAKETFIGRKEFTAPEVFASSEGPACDVYSLGIVFYCLLAGSNGVAEDFDVRKHAQGLPPQVKGLVQDMLQPVPHLRIKMDEVTQELEKKLRIPGYY